MKFWELNSIFRREPAALRAVLEKPRWAEYKRWHDQFDQLIDAQRREILDMEMPDALCRDALGIYPRKFIVRDGWLRECETGGDLTALEVYQRFGGSVIEDAQEKGTAYVDEESP